jgi:hypothetical protein
MRRRVVEQGAAPADMPRKHIPGVVRVAVRANYVGLPSMAGRGTDEGGESRRIRGEEALSGPRKYGPEPINCRKWSAGRRGILSRDADA